MKAIKAVLFDLDGTLLDSQDAVLRSFRYALEMHGIDVPTDEILKQFAGYTVFKAYGVLAPDIPNETIVDTHRQYQYANIQNFKLFPGSVELVKTLHDSGFKLAIVTSRAKFLPEISQQTGIAPYLSTIVGHDDVPLHKPHPDALILALKRLGCQPEEAIMIGDSAADILGGKNAGVAATIAVLHDPDMKTLVSDCSPDYIATSFSEIPGIISNITAL